MTAAIEERIARLAAAVSKDELSISVLSTGERIAVALVLDLDDLFPGSSRAPLPLSRSSSHLNAIPVALGEHCAQTPASGLV
jgi:hypothetical protein